MSLLNSNMCDKYNLKISLEPGLKKLLFSNEEIPFDENFIKPCNDKECPKYREIPTKKNNILGYCIE